MKLPATGGVSGGIPFGSHENALHRFLQESREKCLAFEAEAMKDVKGWKVGESVYKTREWMPPMPKFGAFMYVFD